LSNRNVPLVLEDCERIFDDGFESRSSCAEVFYNGVSGVMLALSYATQEEAKRIVNALADCGKITMPLAPTFWAKTFGMVTDRFGVGWGINCEEIPL
jgi:uncharacterized glyoxalase superfamily protein PhnB